MTVEVDAGARRHEPPAPEPPVAARRRRRAGHVTHNVFLAGIGGTGIVTVNQVLATAALRAGLRRREPRPDRVQPEGRPRRVAPALRAADAPAANRLTPGTADCLIAFDLLAAADAKNLGYGGPARPSASRRPARPRPARWSTTRSVAYPDDAPSC